MADLLFVSVKQSFNPTFTVAQLAPWVERAWAQLTPEKAKQCDRVIAVFEGYAVAAWRLRGAYYLDDYTWGDGHKRIALSLGEPLAVLPEYQEIASTVVLRRGARTVQDNQIAQLPPERDEDLLDA